MFNSGGITLTSRKHKAPAIARPAVRTQLAETNEGHDRTTAPLAAVLADARLGRLLL
jgi:hypothetical protein